MQVGSENSNQSARPRGVIKDRFGSRKGLLRFFYYEMLRLVGKFRAQTRVDFQQVSRLVFVCQGNICRSPLGEAVAKAEGITAISFGLNTRGDAPADPRALAWAATKGLDLHSHRTQRVDQYQPRAGDLLIAMEPKHLKQLQTLFANQPVQLTLAGLWLPNPFAYLHDPYNTNEVFFDRCEETVFKATAHLCKRLNGNG